MILQMVSLTLDLRDVDGSLVDKAKQHCDDMGVKITVLPQEPDEELSHILYDVHNECRKSQPPAHLRNEPIPYDRWLSTFLNPHWDKYIVAWHCEEPIGVGFLEPMKDDESECGFLGVLPAWRGRGVARGIKATMILQGMFIKNVRLTTQVLEANRAMMVVNEHFGFKRCSVRDINYPD